MGLNPVDFPQQTHPLNVATSHQQSPRQGSAKPFDSSVAPGASVDVDQPER